MWGGRYQLLHWDPIQHALSLSGAWGGGVGQETERELLVVMGACGQASSDGGKGCFTHLLGRIPRQCGQLQPSNRQQLACPHGAPWAEASQNTCENIWQLRKIRTGGGLKREGHTCTIEQPFHVPHDVSMSSVISLCLLTSIHNPHNLPCRPCVGMAQQSDRTSVLGRRHTAMPTHRAQSHVTFA